MNSLLKEKIEVKKVLFIHGYNGIPPIFDWLKQELEKLEYTVIMPNLPPREGVRYSIWKKEFDKIKEDLQGALIVVAHSAGNPFIIKYLKESDLAIKQYIGLAGFSDNYVAEGREDLNKAIKSMVPSLEEIEYFRNKVKDKYCIYSDNDHIVPFEILQKHANNIGGKYCLIPNIGHMGKKSGLQRIPKVVELIKNC